VSHYGFLGGDLDEWKARGEGGGEVHRADVNADAVEREERRLLGAHMRGVNDLK
jgi:hypothetical protein